ncbi:DapH/DapD/GlmU-related protein [Serratia nevei]|uniref:DapH/DapD/GlmU-related protein n=1 Tax=Serratia TaxID=613 RepID=UPI0027E58050|nr:DapH/DapD/GlmU-related protein [Serratia marcescens]
MLKYFTYLLRKKVKPCHARLFFNNSTSSKKKKHSIISKSGVKVSSEANIMTPFYYEYGNIEIIGDVFVNANCTFLDDEKIIINDGSMIGPNVTLSTVSHHVTPENRHDKNITAPITIGKNVWICAGAVILPGVTIGDNSVIGANSVVNCNVPENTLYAGTPAVFKKNL